MILCAILIAVGGIGLDSLVVTEDFDRSSNGERGRVDSGSERCGVLVAEDIMEGKPACSGEEGPLPLLTLLPLEAVDPALLRLEPDDPLERDEKRVGGRSGGVASGEDEC